jgi:hypothetical protein
MRQTLIAVLAVFSILGAGSALAQQPETAVHTFSHRTVWSFDPVHGVMQGAPVNFVSDKPLTGAVVDTAATTTTYTGTIDLTVKINLISATTKGAALRCAASLEPLYEVTSTTVSFGVSTLVGGTSQSVDAVIAGSTATCTFSVPYSWTIPASTSTTTVTVEGIGGSVGVAEDEIEISGAVARVYRSTTVAISGPSTIPPDGTKTTLTASTVL